MSTLDDMGQLPIFKLSLGSKELFHSNFLEFLWDYDKNCFIEMVNSLLKSTGKSITLYQSSDLRREKEHFDLCIFNEEKPHIVYDLVLENKVKSLPDKGQLDRYVGDIQKKKGGKGTIFVLLSLAKEFPDKKGIEDEKKWIVVNYKELADAIRPESWPPKPGYSYISDYKAFIEKLDALGDDILNNLEKEYLFHYVNNYKKERLHDLYYKLRCTKFLALLKEILEKDPRIKGKIPIVFIEHNQIRKQRTPGVFLNVNIYRGVGQAAVFLYNGKGKGPGKGDIYEIVIQGDQYRHGINQDKKMDPKKRWDSLSQSGDFSQSFLTNILGSKPSKGRCEFNHYGKNYVYKYRKMVTFVPDPDKQSTKKPRKRKAPVDLLDLNVSSLLKLMAGDVLNTAEKLGIIGD